MSAARILTVMGSGETSPTMVKTHREVLARFDGPRTRAVLLATPFAFQENAADIAARAATYFHESLQLAIEPIGLPSSPAARLEFLAEREVSQLRAAELVFSGPGSPTYALGVWRDSVVPPLLSAKLLASGAVTFASAAAVTLGRHAVPVYEIYKVGEPPVWRDGLDVIGLTGLPVAVIPHFDNAEGGTHDTRFCYLGERRLRLLEEQLPEGEWVLGIDEHTACVFDLEEGTATVAGHGTVTVRAQGRSAAIGTGQTVPITRLAEMAAALALQNRAQARGAPGVAGPVPAVPAPSVVDDVTGGAPRLSPMLSSLAEIEERYRSAVGCADAAAIVRAILEVEELAHAWSADTFQSDEAATVRASLRSMIVELGALAEKGTADPREVVGPFVEVLLTVRAGARAAGRYDEADVIRDRLVELGVEVRDGSNGPEWLLADGR